MFRVDHNQHVHHSKKRYSGARFGPLLPLDCTYGEQVQSVSLQAEIYEKHGKNEFSNYNSDLILRFAPVNEQRSVLCLPQVR